MFDFAEVLEWAADAIDDAREEGGMKSILASLLITAGIFFALVLAVVMFGLYMGFMVHWPLTGAVVTIIAVIFITVHANAG